MFKRNVIYQLDPGAFKPTKVHPSDAGYDLYAREDVEIGEDKTLKVDTGVHVLIPEGYVGLVLPRSSFNCLGVATPTGVIDAGYTGSIAVVLTARFAYKIYAGNRIAQLVIVPLPDIRLVEGVVTTHRSERGAGGFGSSGL